MKGSVDVMLSSTTAKKLFSAEQAHCSGSSVGLLWLFTLQLEAFPSTEILVRERIENRQSTFRKMGSRGSVVVAGLCYTPEGRGFETR
jgi:hypothetical protein